MLIEKKPVAGDIVTIRMTSGEEIVGKLSMSSDSNSVKLNSPIIVGIQMLPNNQASLSFLPLLVSTDEDASVSFPNHSIMIMPMKTRKDVAAQYLKSTSSLEIPDAATSALFMG